MLIRLLSVASTCVALCYAQLDCCFPLFQIGQLDAAIDGVKWVTDWLIKAHPKDNVFYGQVRQKNLMRSMKVLVAYAMTTLACSVEKNATCHLLYLLYLSACGHLLQEE